jgi:glycosyltransferase involved in cell wall biosynthesis
MTLSGPDGSEERPSVPVDATAGPTVSVVMPVFNGAAGIADSLAGIEGQTYGDFEVLIVDDGSTDGTSEVLGEYARTSPRVRLFRLPENRGVAVARNTALTMARGRYVWLIDHDDDWSPDFLRVMVGAAEETGADVVVCGAGRRNPDGSPGGVIEAARAWSGEEPGGYLRRLLTGEVKGYLWNKLFRRELFGPDPFPPLSSQSDFAGHFLLADRVRRVVGVDRTLYQHVTREGSITRSTPKMHNLNTCGQIVDHVVGPSVGAEDAALLRFFHLWFAHLGVVNTALRLGARDARSVDLVRQARHAIGWRDVLVAWRYSRAVALRAAAVRAAWPIYARAYELRRARAHARASGGTATAERPEEAGLPG